MTDKNIKSSKRQISTLIAVQALRQLENQVEKRIISQVNSQVWIHIYFLTRHEVEYQIRSYIWSQVK